MAIWQYCIAKYSLVIGIHILLNTQWKLGNTLLLNRHNRVSSFYWTRGSKLCFLTRFSYFSRYFLILVLQNCYSLIFPLLSRLLGNPISCPVFLYLWHSKVVRCTFPPYFGHKTSGFLEARCSWEPGIRLTIGDLSPFRLLPKVSGINARWANTNHTFLTHKNP